MSVNKGMDKKVVAYIYTMDYYSAIKMNEIILFGSTWMDLQVIILSEVSQIEKDKYYMISFICRIIKIIQMNLFTKQKQTYIEHKLMVTKEKRGGD